MADRWRCYEVTVEGFPSFVLPAPSRSKAMAESWRRYNDGPDISFRDFLKVARARLVPTPRDDGYEYVRRVYGVNPRIGQRVRLQHEGPSSGLEGVVVYPGPSTAYVKVVLDGRDFPVNVHPDNVELLERADA
jgi:hypothetical protein